MPEYEVIITFGNGRNVAPTRGRLEDLVARGFEGIVARTEDDTSCTLKLVTSDIDADTVRGLALGLQANPVVGSVRYVLQLPADSPSSVRIFKTPQ
jgi:hypothetical protein